MAIPLHQAQVYDAPVVHLEAAGRTDVGKVRRRNEDRICIGSWRSGHNNDLRESRHQLGDQPLLLAVADGMGGYSGGEMAAETVLNRLQTTRWTSLDENQVRDTLRTAASDLKGLANRVNALTLMGSTIAGVLMDGTELLAFNVGDSRVYRWRAGWLQQLSTDDRDPTSGMLTHVLTASAGLTRVHMERHSLREGDRLFLCSDGLTGRVMDEELAHGLLDGAEGAEALFNLALSRGATDNVSVVYAEVHLA